MRPILVAIPSKLLFVAALVVALGLFVRDLVQRRAGKEAPFSSTPIYLLVGAIVIFFKLGDAGFGHPWRPVPIYSYGVMLGTSLVVGWFLAMKFAAEDHIDPQEAGTIYMYTAVWAIIGSRVLWFINALTDPTQNVSLLDLFKVWQGGLVAYGGMIGGFLASWYGCHKRKIPLLKWADVSAPSVVLGTGITRLGCFLFGCDYGARTNLPWAVRFPGPNTTLHKIIEGGPTGSPAWQHHVHDLGMSAAATWSYPVHPTQLYESLAGLFLFGLLIFIRRHRTFSGQVFLGWVLGYGILRPLIEMVRDDQDRGVYPLPFTNLSFSTSQYIGGISVILGLGLLVALLRRYKRDPESLRLWLTPALATPGGAAGGSG
ncbi:MAG TPA: prolipoprotein diacylglyceryl transferase, partial [Polyangia bacterium]|nr:prolipoprotein diacylglyceryl transferase [Polyangia bacterium]